MVSNVNYKKKQFINTSSQKQKKKVIIKHADPISIVIFSLFDVPHKNVTQIKCNRRSRKRVQFVKRTEKEWDNRRKRKNYRIKFFRDNYQTWD